MIPTESRERLQSSSSIILPEAQLNWSTSISCRSKGDASSPGEQSKSLMIYTKQKCSFFNDNTVWRKLVKIKVRRWSVQNDVCLSRVEVVAKLLVIALFLLIDMPNFDTLTKSSAIVFYFCSWVMCLLDSWYIRCYCWIWNCFLQWDH